MPYILSHLSFALPLGEALGCCTSSSRDLFALGALGPDIYFFDRLPPTPFRPNQKRHGNRLHDTDCAVLARAFLEQADESLLPYVYGFLTHIALDSTVHPYICALYSGPDHTRFEGDIDAIFYERFRDRIPFASVLNTPKELDALDALITSVSNATVSAGVPGAYARSLRKMLRLFPVLYDPRGKRFHAVAKAERLIGKDGVLSAFMLAAPRHYFEDCMNDAHRVWHAETFPDVPRTESIDELFAEADALARKLLRAAMDRDLETVCSLCAHRTMGAGPLP